MPSIVALALAGTLALAPELESRFVRIDANGDGFIRQHEAWADERVEQRFKLADRNQDGKLDRAEFQELIIELQARSAGRAKAHLPFTNPYRTSCKSSSRTRPMPGA